VHVITGGDLRMCRPQRLGVTRLRFQHHDGHALHLGEQKEHLPQNLRDLGPRAEGHLHATRGKLECPPHRDLLQCRSVHDDSPQPCWMIPIFCHTLRAISEVSASIPSTASSTSPSVVCSANRAALLPTSDSISVQKSR